MAYDRFRDVYLPSSVLSYDVEAMPYWSTGITLDDGGNEQINQRWAHPLRRFNTPEAAREHSQVEELRNHFLIMRGPAYFFPFRDPTDFSSTSLQSAGVSNAIAFNNQVIGTGDGINVDFQLVKTYTSGGFTYVRPIKIPITSSVLIGVNGVSTPAGWSVSREGGVVTFDAPPTAGHQITAGFLFDVPVRFEGDDALGQIIKSYRVSGFSDLTLVEVRPC